MINPSISAKKKFQILIKLMNNQKFSIIPTLIENDKFINDPKIKSDILNTHFANKSTVDNPDDEIPFLNPLPGINKCESINTSPLETAKIIRLTTKITIFPLRYFRQIFGPNFNPHLIFSIKTTK